MRLFIMYIYMYSYAMYVDVCVFRTMWCLVYIWEFTLRSSSLTFTNEAHLFHVDDVSVVMEYINAHSRLINYWRFFPPRSTEIYLDWLLPYQKINCLRSSCKWKLTFYDGIVGNKHATRLELVIIASILIMMEYNEFSFLS